MLRLGAGDDYVSMDSVTTESQCTIHGGSGYDSFQDFGNTHLAGREMKSLENPI